MPKLYEALQQLADQDPFINIRKNDEEREISVSLYGEVQKEVIKALLAADYKLDVVFEGTRIVCVEQLIGIDEAAEEIDYKSKTFFWATIGLRVEPDEPDSGIVFRRSVELGSLPHAFHKAIEETVRSTLQQGLYGWEVLDILVTLTRTGYASPVSAVGDFRKLTPLVLMNALKKAGTTVFEPVNQFELEVPIDSTSAVLTNLVECHATPETPTARGATYVIKGTIPARTVPEFEQKLPGLSQGEGILITRFHSYRPVTGPVPTRRRPDNNPLDSRHTCSTPSAGSDPSAGVSPQPHVQPDRGSGADASGGHLHQVAELVDQEQPASMRLGRVRWDPADQPVTQLAAVADLAD